MSHQPEEPIVVSDEEVTVEKSYAADDFPVPAMRFDISSDHDEPIDIRLVDDIPEDFPMESVGFHPEYESDNWTAYKDHRVEFERTLEPNEDVTTVYGIRLDDEEQIQGFLREPQLELRGEASAPADPDAVDETVDEVLGEDANQVVRDVLAGDRETVPGLEEEPETAAEGDVEVEEPTPESASVSSEAGPEGPSPDEEIDISAPEPDEEIDVSIPEEEESAEPAEPADAEPEPEIGDLGENLEEDLGLEGESESEPEPRGIDEDTLPAMNQRPSDAGTLGEDFDEASAESSSAETSEEISLESQEDISESEEAVPESGEAIPESEEAAQPTIGVDSAESVESAGSAEPEAQAGVLTGESSVAAALATEIREGEVDDEDLETLRDELDLGLPASVDARIQRLQSEVEDLQAYSDAMEQFLDENGTAQELIDGFRDDVASLEETVGDLQTEVAETQDGQADLADDVHDLEAEMDDVSDEMDDVSDDVEDVEDEVEEIEDDVEDVADDLETVREQVDQTEERVKALQTDVTENAEDLDSLDDEMGEVRDDLAQLDSDIVDAEEALETEVDDIRAELAEIQDELDEIEEFRERLNSVFGGGEQA